MKKYLVELVGAFFLTFTLALTGGNPLAVGGVLVAFVYMGAMISGAHYNPAVTLGALLRGRIAGKQALLYMLAQVIGAALAAGLFWAMAKTPFVPTAGEGLGFPLILICEFLFTFALVSVVLHVCDDKVKDNSYYGLAIGFTVMAGAFAAGQISGAVFNPAIGLGPWLVDIKEFASNGAKTGMYLAQYVVAPLAAGALAAGFHALTSKEEKRA